MTYFSKFPLVTYDFTTDDDFDEVVYPIIDITTRVAKYTDLISEDVLIDDYFVLEGESPEIISYKLYGTTDYHWTLFYVNSITNFITDWPKRDVVMAKLVADVFDHEVPNPASQHLVNGYTHNIISGVTTTSILHLSDPFYDANPAMREMLTEHLTVGMFIVSDKLPVDTEYEIADLIYNNTTSLLEKIVLTPNLTPATTTWDGINPTIEVFGFAALDRMAEAKATKFYASAETGIVGTKDSIENLIVTTPDGNSYKVSTGDTARAYSFEDYEFLVNEDKKVIKAIKPEYIEEFVKRFERELTK